MDNPLPRGGAVLPAADSSSPALSAVEVRTRQAELDAALDDLAGIVAGAVPLHELLHHVADAAMLAIPHADGVGVCLLRLDLPDNRVQALVASHPFVSKIDAIQYEFVDEGPCITAAAQRTPVCSGDVTADARWPRFGPRVGRLGVNSVLSLPMLLPDGTVVGAINTYSRSRDDFDEHAGRVGARFAASAGLAVHNAQVLADAQDRAAHLQVALGSRAGIDQAIGIIRSRTGVTADEAFVRLREISQNENVRLAAVAERVVDEAVRRARARHATS